MARRDRLLVAGALAAICTLAVGRVVLGGFDAMGTDQSRYLVTGLSLLGGRGFTTEAGDLFLFRSPAYPLYLASAFSVGGELAAYLAAWLVGLAGLMIAVGLAYGLGGVIAAAATATFLACVPMIWEQIASVGIDLPQTALLLAALPLFWSPRLARWVAGGLVLSLAILVKETAAPVAVAVPLAWLPIWSPVSWRRWFGLTAGLAVTVAQAVSWWWLYVWFTTGRIFPLNSLDAIVYDAADVSEPTSSGAALAAVAGALLVASVVLRIRGRDPRIRVMVASLAGAAPAALVAITAAQPSRNVLPLVAITTVVAGVVVGEAAAFLRGRHRTAAIAVLTAVAVVGVGLGQWRAAPAIQDRLPGITAAFVEPQVSSGEVIVSSQRYRSPLGFALFHDDVAVRSVPTRPADPLASPDTYIWLGLRRGTLFAIDRDDWVGTLTEGPVKYLVVAEPHPLSPSELLPLLAGDVGQRNGLRLVEQIEGPTATVNIFEVDAAAVAAPPAIRLHARPEALLAWLASARRAGQTNAAADLTAASAVTLRRAAGLGELMAELGDTACFRPAREEDARRIIIEARDDQARCLASDEVSP